MTNDTGLVNYEGGSGSLTVCNAEGSVVLEREILHDERASHIGIVRLLDQNGDPVESEAVTFYSEGFGEEVLETDENGEVDYSVTTAPSDALLREVTVRDETRDFGITRGTSVIEFIVSGDSDSDEDDAASNGSDDAGGTDGETPLLADRTVVTDRTTTTARTSTRRRRPRRSTSRTPTIPMGSTATTPARLARRCPAGAPPR